MPLTKNRHFGPTEEEDEIILSPTVDAPSVAGAYNYSTAQGHKFRDATGTRLLRETKTTVTVTSAIAANTDTVGSGGGQNLSGPLPDMATGNFLSDYDVYLNGELLEGGADLNANKHYYAGVSLAAGNLRFEFDLVSTGEPDRITVVKKG